MAVAACVLAAGCSFNVPESKFYLLQPPLIDAAAKQSQATVGVRPISITRVYDEERIAYRDSDYSVGYFHYHRWAAPPGSLLTEAVVDLLKQSGRFAAVEQDAGARDYDVTVSGALREFCQDERAETFSARLTVDWTVSNDAGRTVQETANCQVALKENSPDALAEAMSAALSGAVAQLSHSIEDAMALE